jgi:hypothetical protein
MGRIFPTLVLSVAAVAFSRAQSSDPVLAKIRSEGLERSQVPPVFEYLTIDIGPRLTASPAQKRAAEWVRDRLSSYGLENSHLEPWAFGRGWTFEKLTLEMIEPRYLPLIGYADGWSAATSGDLVATPVFVGGKSPEGLTTLAAQLKGAIVMPEPIVTSFVRHDRPDPSSPDYQADVAATTRAASRRPPPWDYTETPQTRALRAAGAAVILRPSVGEHGTVGGGGRDGGPGAVPSVTMSAEHYNMIARMLEKKIPVKLRVNVQSTFHNADGGNAYNVIAELPGADPALKDEVVMIGAHLDSFHTAVGATDNADGATTVIEAMRILKAVGARPRRTIRVALWSGEEQGLLGSKAWVAQHLAGDANRAARDKFDVYLNIDNGTGPIYGWYLQNNEEVHGLFDGWLDPLKSLGVRRNTIEPIGASDHLSFIDVGVPAFNPIQDYVNYDVRTRHTNMDTVERVDEKDIQQAAVVMAMFAYHAAMLDRKIPNNVGR